MRAGKERGICFEECGKRRTRLSYQTRPRRFFEESKAFFTEFVGAENVVSTMVHMDEKTSHMHFFYVSVTQGKRLKANKIIRVRVCLIFIPVGTPEQSSACSDAGAFFG